MYLYSGTIDCGNNEADYEFESDEILDVMAQLEYLLASGILQIVDNAPEEIEEED